jgi:CARDB protein
LFAVRRLVLLIALFALAAPAAAYAQQPPLRAKVTACSSGPLATGRTATFTGSMPAIKGARRMWMRFDVLAHTGAVPGFAPLKVPGLGVWQKSVPGRPGGFVFAQRVQGLLAPGAYKAVVRFRWYGKGGRLLRAASRETAVCKQLDQRPDLQAGRLDAVLGPDAGEATYTLVVRNAGRGPAGAFDVLLSGIGPDQPTQRVTALDAGDATTLVFAAPRCAPGSTLRLTVDARAEVVEADEADDVVERTCPLAQ